ncbi:MAG: flavodoxin family protein, partial [Anaerolineae bacterium]|nr:flavodoxin family protein [Anaerolineae bacterium]
MSIEIYYYSGTGNSLHVARELQERIPEASLTPIVRLLRNDTIKTSAETVGFVFPNFCLTIPIPLYDFLEKADLSSAQYIFALCTRGGSHSEAFEYMNQLLAKQGKKLSAQLDINMPWNLPLGQENLIGLNSAERIRHLESVMMSKLDAFWRHVVAGEEHIEPDPDADFELSFGMKLFDLLVPKSLNYQSHRYMYQELVRFYADANCGGCGTCEKVCLSDNTFAKLSGETVRLANANAAKSSQASPDT